MHLIDLNIRNAFRPRTTSELLEAFRDAHEDTTIGVVLLSLKAPRLRTEYGPFAVEEIKKPEDTKAMLEKMDIID